jgi:hypothetical protein
MRTMDEQPHAPKPARPAAVPATRWEALLYRLMLVWGFLLIAAIIVGIVGFLIHFLALQ